MKNTLLQLRHRLDLLSIGQKLTLIVILSSLLPVLIMISLISGQIYSMTLADTLRKNQQDVASIAPVIDDKLEEIVSQVNSLREEPYYRQLFSAESASPGHLPPSLEEENAFYGHVNQIIQNSDIDHIRIYMDLPAEHPLFTGRATSVLQPMSRIRGSHWHGIFEGSRITELFCPPFYLSNREQKELGDIAYILPISHISQNGNSARCYLAAYFSTGSIMEILNKNIQSDDSVFYIMNERDATVVTTDSNLSGLYYQNYSEIYNSLISSNNFIEKEVLGQLVYFSFRTINRPRWFLVCAVPRSYILRETVSYDTRIFLIIFAIFSIAMFFTLRLSRSVGQRISSVVRTMSRTKEGTLVPLDEPEIMDEIGELISTYNYMTRQQEELKEDLKKTADELRVAEVNALQAQINPHFLYNTLDTIHWMALSGKTTEITGIVHDLSRFYKLTLGKNMTNTTVEKELEQVSAYVDLQNIRFNNAIQLIIDIPEDLKDLLIPRLTLQPIVENSILHGIREKDPPTGTVIITGWVEGDKVCLLISDDGIGMEDSLIPKLLTKEGIGLKTTGTNIAVYNVHHRLQLLYGEDYGLSYQSVPGKGTDVRVTLPMQL